MNSKHPNSRIQCGPFVSPTITLITLEINRCAPSVEKKVDCEANQCIQSCLLNVHVAPQFGVHHTN